MPFVLPALLLGWVIWWISRLGATLINDEYAAIDYFYRVVREGHLFPTPDKLHKPLSLLTASVAWLFESPVAFEVAISMYAALFVAMFYLVLKRTTGPVMAAIAGVALVFHPDLMYYSATGSTVLPLAGLSFVGLYAVLRKDDSPIWLWVYALVFLASGLFRPVSWLFAAPAVYWWWPGWKDRKGLLRLLIALCIISMGPVIWFGKDWIINDNLIHGLAVATRDKAVGTGAPLPALHILSLFGVRISNRVSTAIALAGAAGMVLFVRQQGLRGLLHPLVVFPVLVGGFIFLVVYMGVYPVQRYWFYDSVFAYFFAAWLVRQIVLKIDMDKGDVARAAVMFCAFWGATAHLFARPASSPPDLRWLLVAAGFAALFFALLVLWSEHFKAALRQTLSVGLIVLLALSYPVFISGLYNRQADELELEARKQKEMKEVARYLKKQFTSDDDVRILIPSRRNEQLNWLFRERERPEVITLREAFFLDWICNEPHKSPVPIDREKQELCRKWTVEGHDFTVLFPDWIVYIPDDYQFWGPARKFEWMKTQEKAVIRGVEIELKMSTGLVRVFKVSYPEDAPRKTPLPSIP